jgi:hypothetical protein
MKNAENRGVAAPHPEGEAQQNGQENSRRNDERVHNISVGSVVCLRA